MGIMPSFRFELRCEGRVAGIDEAGRGPLAGPVYAAAAVIDRTRAARKLLRMIDDSKKLTLEQREEAYEAMIASGVVQFAVAEASVEEIDRLNILQATFLAMQRAVEGLHIQPRLALIDGNRCPKLAVPSAPVIQGDAKVPAIAAASILAKVSRDREMVELDLIYPGYGLAGHKGYPTPAHLEALRRLGPTAIHRRSFAPVRALLDD